MKKKNNNGIIVGVLIGVIIILLIVIVLFATNIISFNTKENNNSNNANEKNYSNNTNENIKENNDEKQNKSNNDIYQEIINQYKEIKNNETSEEAEIDHNRYNYVFFADCNSYQCIKQNKWYYNYYDINKDNQEEILISYYDDYTKKKFVTSIFTSDGTSIKKFAEYWSRSRLYGIYDNGLIVENGSSGASVSYFGFKTIDNSINKEYTLNYSESKVESIVETNTENKTNYTSEEELLSDNIGNNQKIDLEKLTWNEIK